MANPTCSQASLINGCYLVPTSINAKQRKALLVYAKALQLAAIGGTDYIGRLSLMVQNAASLACGMGQADRDAAQLSVQFNNATAAGAVVPSTMNGKFAAIACFVELDDKALDEIDLLLNCKLGRAKAYPQ